MHRYAHITVIYSSDMTHPTALEPAITAVATDWIRYTPNTWVLWSDKPLGVITGQLRSHLLAADHVLAVGLNPYDIPAGFMPQWVWDWFNRARDPQTGQVNWPPPPLPPPGPATRNIFANALVPHAPITMTSNPLTDLSKK